jgi:AcrR family transcriptional regulator
MNKQKDPRLVATRNHALDAATIILQDDGVLAVTHGAVGKATGISRSTLYRHWPEIAQLRNDAFKRSASPLKVAPKTDGPLRADLTWVMGILVDVLNDSPWGQIAPQVIAAAATDADAKAVIRGFMRDRIAYVQTIFDAAEARGELRSDAPVDELIEMTIAVPYFRKLITGSALNKEWIESHVDVICRLAEGP